MRERWQHPKGGTIGIDACAVDSGDGGHMDLVHAFTRPRYGRRVVSTKGVAGFSRPYLQRSGTKGHPLFLVGSDAVKTMIFARAARNEGLRFSETLDPVYFEQLTSERRVVRYSRGRPVARFERIPGKRAETLDATVYAVAVRQMIGMKEDRRAEELESKAAPKRTRVVKSKWLEG